MARLNFSKAANIILLLGMLGMEAIAQKTKKELLSRYDVVLQGAIESNEGSIILNDGKELAGLIAYNDKTGILKYENGNDSRSLTARNVLAFEVYDPIFDGNRIFYSIEYFDPVHELKRPMFFELIHDFKDFAVLTKKDPLNAREKKSWPATQSDNVFIREQQKVVLEQVETFYFLRPKEEPTPYFSVTVSNNVGSALFQNRKVKEKFVDRDVFEDYIGPSAYEKLRTYTTENGLSFKEKSDFLKILDYYQTLID
jgi:hypothetical protein